MSEQMSFKFEYNIQFEKVGNKYRLVHYNQWHNSDEKAFDDIRVMFEGKDLKDNELPLYKVVEWEDLDNGKYTAKVNMILYEKKDLSIEQVFTLNSLEKVKLQDEQS